MIRMVAPRANSRAHRGRKRRRLRSTSDEGIIDVTKHIPQEQLQNRAVEEIVGSPGPQIQ